MPAGMEQITWIWFCITVPAVVLTLMAITAAVVHDIKGFVRHSKARPLSFNAHYDDFGQATYTAELTPQQLDQHLQTYESWGIVSR